MDSLGVNIGDAPEPLGIGCVHFFRLPAEGICRRRRLSLLHADDGVNPPGWWKFRSVCQPTDALSDHDKVGILLF